MTCPGQGGRSKGSGTKKRREGARRSSGGGRSGKASGAGGPGAKAADRVREFVRGLAETERIALIVRDELFGGSWQNMREDLEARAAGRPYVFKLASRIEEDLKAVEKLGVFEQRHEVNLADYL